MNYGIGKLTQITLDALVESNSQQSQTEYFFLSAWFDRRALINLLLGLVFREYLPKPMSAIANNSKESYLINAAPTRELNNWRGKSIWTFFTGLGLLLIGWLNIALLTRYPTLVGWLPAGV